MNFVLPTVPDGDHGRCGNRCQHRDGERCRLLDGHQPGQAIYLSSAFDFVIKDSVETSGSGTQRYHSRTGTVGMRPHSLCGHWLARAPETTNSRGVRSVVRSASLTFGCSRSSSQIEEMPAYRRVFFITPGMAR